MSSHYCCYNIIINSGSRFMCVVDTASMMMSCLSKVFGILSDMSSSSYLQKSCDPARPHSALCPQMILSDQIASALRHDKIRVETKYEVSAVNETWRVIIGWIIQQWKKGGVLMKVENVDKRSKVIHHQCSCGKSHSVSLR